MRLLLLASVDAYAAECRPGHPEACRAVADAARHAGDDDAALVALRVGCDDDDPLACRDAGLIAAARGSAEAAFLLHAACAAGDGPGCRAAAVLRLEEGSSALATSFAIEGCQFGDHASCALAAVLDPTHAAAATWLAVACPLDTPVAGADWSAEAALACEALAQRLWQAGDLAAARRLLADACARAHAPSCRAWARIDEASAGRALAAGCEAGDAASCTAAGASAWADQRPEAAINFWVRACAANDGVACAAVAAARFTARGPDTVRERACTLGDVPSCVIAGWSWQDTDPARAAMLFRAGCAGQDPDACLRLGADPVDVDALGAACDVGTGAHCAHAAALVPSIDPGLARVWWERACALGEAAACAEAGRRWWPLDPERARTSLVVACPELEPSSSCALLQTHDLLRGDPSVLPWLRRACHLGVAEACDAVVDALPQPVRPSLKDALCKKGYTAACSP